MGAVSIQTRHKEMNPLPCGAGRFGLTYFIDFLFQISTHPITK
uniref:Uncharacterized protein n=1 Tax=Arundo donax TaxID=35708 RepID=A0A0A8YVF4_ARUDO